MRFKWWAHLGAWSIIGVTSAAGGQTGASASVTAQGFCITRIEMRCQEVVLPGGSVSYERLPKAGDGARIIYFYSDQQPGSKLVLVHLLEAEDKDRDVKITQTEPSDSRLSSALKAIAKKR